MVSVVVVFMGSVVVTMAWQSFNMCQPVSAPKQDQSSAIIHGTQCFNGSNLFGQLGKHGKTNGWVVMENILKSAWGLSSLSLPPQPCKDQEAKKPKKITAIARASCMITTATGKLQGVKSRCCSAVKASSLLSPKNSRTCPDVYMTTLAVKSSSQLVPPPTRTHTITHTHRLQQSELLTNLG